MAREATEMACPYCRGRMRPVKAACPECGVAVEGEFRLPRVALLSPDEAAFLAEFILAGFSIKTTDGLVIMGTHNMCFNSPIARSSGSEIAIFKFSIKLPLHAGDYFFDIGTIDMGRDVLDRRCSAIHLYVHESNRFDGITYLETHFHEVERKKLQYAQKDMK